MRDLYEKIKNSEFLSYGELLRLKVMIVLSFLFIFAILTVPVSVFEDFSIGLAILIPSLSSLMFILSLLTLFTNRIRVSMHFSIYTFIGLTLYYVLGSNLLYGYLFLFATLIIIIFYQDIYTYLVYGGALTIYGIYYIYDNGALLMSIHEQSVFYSNLMYQGILGSFYLVFLVYIVISDATYETLNYDYLRIRKKSESYQAMCLKYLDEIDDKAGRNPVHDNTAFQKAVNEVCVFINEFFEKNGQSISEVVEFYFFLHHHDIDEILANPESKELTRKFTNELSKYIIHKNSEMNAIYFDFVTNFKNAYNIEAQRYEFQVNHLCTNRVNKLIVLALIYKYLKTERTQYDKWGRIDRSFAHDEVIDLMKQKSFREFILYEDATFMVNNQELFDKYFR